MKNSFIIYLSLSLLVNQLNAQDQFKNQTENFDSNKNWHLVKKGITVSSDKLVSNLAKEYQQPETMSIKEYRLASDSILGDKRDYLQYYNNIPIEDGWISCFEKNGKAYLITGKIMKLQKDFPKTYISEKEALDVAIKYLNAKKYIWEDTVFENELKMIKKDSLATNYPKGELLFAKIKENAPDNNENYDLSWRFEITSLIPFNHSIIYIDALTGKFLKERSLIFKANGNCITLYDGPKSFTTEYRGFPNFDYILKDKTRTDGGLCVKWWSNWASNNYHWDITGHIDDGDNDWSAVEERPATSLLWGMERTYDYFHNTYYWHGTEGNNDEVRGAAEGDDTYYTRVNYTDYIVTGRVFGNSTASPEAIGHEYTHGIIAHTSNLNYVAAESGALNESFADIFGTSIERYIRGSNDWNMGTDFGVIRSLSSPNTYGDPDFYLEPGFWYNGADVGTYTHTNNGVQNNWFYRLSNLVGFDKAIRIAWYNMKSLNTNANYQDARAGSINTANNLYYECSSEAGKVADAWAAVGVGAQHVFCVSIQGPTELCMDDEPVIYTAISDPVASYTWTFPSGWVYTTSGNKATVTNIPDLEGNRIIRVRAVYYDNIATRNLNVEIIDCGGHPLKATEAISETEYTNQDDISTQKPQILVFPNPVNDILNVHILGIQGNAYINLFDLTGNLILSTNTYSPTTDIDFKNISNGMYVLNIISNNNIYIQKICVNK